MSTAADSATGRRTSLTRDRIVQQALSYIDEHGLGALSMHKLGAVLDVRGMSLYHHVANKEDLFDGVVEALWESVESSARPETGKDWRGDVRTLAHAVRDMVRGHPHAASLIFGRPRMAQAALRIVQTHQRSLVEAGFEPAQAYDLLRTIWSYAFGSALAEITWDSADPGSQLDVRRLLTPGTPDELAAVADVFCGQSDGDAQFELGLELMLSGIERV